MTTLGRLYGSVRAIALHDRVFDLTFIHEGVGNPTMSSVSWASPNAKLHIQIEVALYNQLDII